jgi:hypothetical protein
MLAKFGNFGLIWANFAPLVVAKSMPKARLKSQKPFNSSTMNPKATWSSSLESYHPYLLPQFFSKIHKILAFIVAYQKTQKANLTSLEL